MMHQPIRSHVAFTLLILAWLTTSPTAAQSSSTSAGNTSSKEAAAAQPQSSASKLSLTLFAQDPEIRTPIGIAIDHHERIFVVESHPHLRPAVYSGLTSDRIRMCEDLDSDGQAGSSWVFADVSHIVINLSLFPAAILTSYLPGKLNTTLHYIMNCKRTKPKSVFRLRIETYHAAQMPAALHLQLSHTEFSDLIKFLASHANKQPTH